MKTTNQQTKTKLFALCEKLFYINTIPIFSETMAGLAALSGTIWSFWSLASLSYIVMMTEVDIYMFSQPIEIQKNSWLGWIIKKSLSLLLRIAEFLKVDFVFFTQAWEYISKSFKTALLIITPNDPRVLHIVKKIISITWYLIMAFCSFTPGVGRIANGIFVKKDQPLFGRFILYLGCIIRFFLIFKGINFSFHKKVRRFLSSDFLVSFLLYAIITV